MAIPDRTNKTGVSESEQTVLNSVFDPTLNSLVVTPGGFDEIHYPGGNDRE